MANAIRDNNREKVLMGVSYVDGTTLVPIKVLASGGNALKVDTVNTLAASINTDALRDGNRHTILMGVNSVDGTLIPVYANPATGEILVDN